MYGILVESVRTAIIENFGMETWLDVASLIGFDGEISPYSIYPDEIFGRVIDALVHIRDIGDHDFYMQFFGQSFVTFFSQYGFDKMLRVAGRNFRDFLYSIDQLHESNRFTFPNMKSPLFFVEKEDEFGAYLHYQTKRRGFVSYVVGQLTSCAKLFYNQDIEVLLHKDISNDEYYHVIFRINFDNDAYRILKFKPSKSNESINRVQTIETVQLQTFLKLFPFYIAFDNDLRIKSTGTNLAKLFGMELNGRLFLSVFKFTRPIVNATWNSIIMHSSSVIFEIENKMDLAKCKGEDGSLKLKGQMKYFPELDNVLFLCHPVLSTIEEMLKIGLYINDLSSFDGSSEMIVTEMQHSNQLQCAIQKQLAWTESLKNTKHDLNKWRNKGKMLLYSMLPKHVAIQIENGMKPNTICETFDQVTVMFMYTTDFGKISADMEPSTIVSFINNTVTMYDSIVGTYTRVFKVEMKADGSYMCVSGIEPKKPTGSTLNINDLTVSSNNMRFLADEDADKKVYPSLNQAELIGILAFEILSKVHNVENPIDDTKSLKVKIGFHTGTVVAAIVGSANIQYCLFGDTVNTASRMTSNSLPGKVNVSETSYELLKDSKYFDTSFRGVIEVKGKGKMNTYWLNGFKEGITLSSIPK